MATKDEQSRRDFVVALGRTAAGLLLGGGVAALLARGGAKCLRSAGCQGCGEIAGCTQPQAVAARRGGAGERDHV